MKPSAPINRLIPKKRTKIRLFAGTIYYTTKRYLLWLFGGLRFAKTKSPQLLPFPQFSHSTPLLRKLKDVDMQLQYNKITNLTLAADKLNGMLLMPGETFSFWKTVGKPTRRKGYLEGLVLFGGTYGKGIGGGLCQLSNLIYWMTLHTELTVTERYRHSYDVFPDEHRTQPFGSGATCVYNYRDLMIKNETARPFQLSLKVTDTLLEGKWFSVSTPYYRYEVYERQHSFRHEYWGGYSRNNVLYRKRFDQNNNLVDDEYLTENHALMMYVPFLEAEEATAGS